MEKKFLITAIAAMVMITAGLAVVFSSSADVDAADDSASTSQSTNSQSQWNVDDGSKVTGDKDITINVTHTVKIACGSNTASISGKESIDTSYVEGVACSVSGNVLTINGDKYEALPQSETGYQYVFDHWYGLNYSMTSLNEDLDLHADYKKLLILNVTITVPNDATVDVGMKGYTGYNFKQFDKVEPTTVTPGETSTVYLFQVTSGTFSISVSGDNYVTYKSLVTVSKDVSYEITSAMLQPEGKTSTSTDYTLLNKDTSAGAVGDNIGGTLVSVNTENHLLMTTGSTFNGYVYRQWEAIDGWMNNNFLEPDFVFTVMNFDGSASDVVKVTSGSDEARCNFNIVAQKTGTAVVVISYKAMTLHDTFYGASWPELCAVIVVTVSDTEQSHFDTGMTITTMGKDGVEYTRAVDSEVDVFYYDSTTSGYAYTFTAPENITSVTVYNPVLGTNAVTSFKEGSTAVSGHSYTVTLTEGRNIVKLTRSDGSVEYQVLTAIPAKITTDLVRNDDGSLTVTVTYRNVHNNDIGAVMNSMGKLAGIYNTNTGMYFTLEDGTKVTVPSHQWGYYFTMSDLKDQQISFTIPAEIVAAQDTYTVKAHGLYMGPYFAVNTDHRVAVTGGTAVVSKYQGISAMPDVTIQLTYEVFIASTDDGLGTVDKTHVDVKYGDKVTVTDNVITIGSTSVTATATKASDANVTNSFVKFVSTGGDTVISSFAVSAVFDAAITGNIVDEKTKAASVTTDGEYIDIDQSTLDKVKSSAESLKITTTVASVSFDKNAISKITEATVLDTTMLERTEYPEKVSEAYAIIDIDFGDNHNFSGGKITVTLKVSTSIKSVAVGYVSDDGQTVTKVDSSYDASTGTVTFDTDHLSNYAVLDSGYFPTPAPSSSDNTLLIAAIVIIAILVLAGVVVYLYKTGRIFANQ